jgi:hypothetical protein
MNARPAVNAKRNSQGCHGMFKVLTALISQSGQFRGASDAKMLERINRLGRNVEIVVRRPSRFQTKCNRIEPVWAA